MDFIELNIFASKIDIESKIQNQHLVTDHPNKDYTFLILFGNLVAMIKGAVAAPASKF